jgi:hypothetical protein
MWHHHQVCAGPNSALPAVNSSIQSYLALGAKPEKLILGLPGYGYEYRCNDSFPSPSTFAPCASSTCIVGDLKHYSTEHYGVGEKTGFFRHLYIKVIFLPRQARDKHRDNSKKARFGRGLEH